MSDEYREFTAGSIIIPGVSCVLGAIRTGVFAVISCLTDGRLTAAAFGFLTRVGDGVFLVDRTLVFVPPKILLLLPRSCAEAPAARMLKNIPTAARRPKIAVREIRLCELAAIDETESKL